MWMYYFTSILSYAMQIQLLVQRVCTAGLYVITWQDVYVITWQDVYYVITWQDVYYVITWQDVYYVITLWENIYNYIVG